MVNPPVVKENENELDTVSVNAKMVRTLPASIVIQCLLEKMPKCGAKVRKDLVALMLKIDVVVTDRFIHVDDVPKPKAESKDDEASASKKRKLTPIEEYMQRPNRVFTPSKKGQGMQWIKYFCLQPTSRGGGMIPLSEYREMEGTDLSAFFLDDEEQTYEGLPPGDLEEKTVECIKRQDLYVAFACCFFFLVCSLC